VFPGFFQANEGQEMCEPCPSGSYCDPFELGNVTGVIIPQDCPEGHYCPQQTEFDTQNPCPAGTFNNVTRLEAEGIEL